MDLVNSNMVALNALAGKLVAAAAAGAAAGAPGATDTTTSGPGAGPPGGAADELKPLKPHHINNHYHLKNHLHSQQTSAVQSQIKSVSSMQSQNNSAATSVQAR